MLRRTRRELLIAAGSALLLQGASGSLALAATDREPTKPGKMPYRFAFGGGKALPDYTHVAPDAVYTSERGYGFETGSGNGKPFAFSVAVPEGNYDVTVTLGGDPAGPSETTVKAESRRLLLERVRTEAGKTTTRKFTVNVRVPVLKNGDHVRLKGEEKAKRDWDDRLTLEFLGTRPTVHSIEIAPAAPGTVTVYIAGDSTVTDQENEPWSAWGQMLPRFFGPGVSIANHAQSGEALLSFAGERRLSKIADTIREGDYLFIQFAHNDQKAGSAHVDPATTYPEQLRRYIEVAHKVKAIPVLVTSMHRRRFDESGKITNTLGDYPDAVRRVAQEDKVALVDLNAMSKTLFEAMGSEGSLRAFVHYPANTFPNQSAALKDDTHFSDYGGYELARCVVEGIRTGIPDLARHLAGDYAAAPPFDPAHPDPFATFALPASAGANGETPAQIGDQNKP